MAIKLRKEFLLGIFLLFSGMSFATTYYVSPTGTGTGTFANPMSFAVAWGKSLSSGDSIILRGGTYYLNSKHSYSKSGSATDYLYIVAYGSEVPILDFRSEPYGSSYPGISMSGSYVYMKGFIIQGAGDNGMIVYGNNDVIENCTFRWNCDSGLQMKSKTGSSNNLIIDCDSYENFDYKSSTIGGNADGFADKQYTSTGTNTYIGCRAWRNSDDGWDSYQKNGNTVYDSCWCYEMAPASFDMSKNIRFKTDSASYFYKFASTNYVITNSGNGNGFKLGGDYTNNNATLHNCVSVKNKVKGFDQNNNNGVMTLYNCTSYLNGYNYGFTNSSYGSLIIKNSVSLSSSHSNYFRTKTVTESNNSWDSGFSCSSADFVSLDDTQLLGDRQADGSLPEVTLLHLVQGSGLIDKGVDVGYSYSGTAPDLGAFEYQVSTAVNNPNEDTGSIVYYSRNNHSIVLKGSFKNVQVFDMTGKVLLNQNTNGEEMNISTSGWQNGIYILKTVNSYGQSKVVKFVIA